MADVAASVRDPERLAALRSLALLDTDQTEAFDRLAVMAARLLRAPVALLTLIDEDRQYFKAAVGLPDSLAAARQTPLDYSVCQYAVASGAPLVICDANVEHWLDDHPAVTELGVRSYAGVPLVMAGGQAIGTLCVLDFEARFWDDDDLHNLEDLAAIVMRELRLHEIERALGAGGSGPAIDLTGSTAAAGPAPQDPSVTER